MGPVFQQYVAMLSQQHSDLEILPHHQQGLLKSCRERKSAKAESFCHSNCILVYASTGFRPLSFYAVRTCEILIFFVSQRALAHHCGYNTWMCVNECLFMSLCEACGRVSVGPRVCVCVCDVFAVLSPSNRYPHPACHLELESSQL